MRIAFVAYPEGVLLPPDHGSMGASLYAIASVFSRSCDVTVYGLKDHQRGAESGMFGGAEYRFFPSTRADRLRMAIRRNYSRHSRNHVPLSTSNWLYPSYAKQVAADLQGRNCDVIHVQHCTQYVPVIRALNPRAKIVLHIHSALLSQSNPAVLGPRLDGVDLLLTVSDYVSAKTALDFPSIADRCETMYNGIESWHFNRERDDRAVRLSKEKRILYVGGVWPHKGTHVLVDAFNSVVERYPNVRLDIVGPQGDYPMEENIDVKERALFESLGALGRTSEVVRLKMKLSLLPPDAGRYLTYVKSRLSSKAARKVFFHGYLSRPELIDCYYNADVFVFPPVWNEAFGCTPLEAMAAGVPVVASRCGGIVETVKDGETGFLVPKNNASALAERILNLLEDETLRETMGQSGRRHVLEKFTWEVIGEAMYNRYQGLCAARPGNTPNAKSFDLYTTA